MYSKQNVVLKLYVKFLHCLNHYKEKNKLQKISYSYLYTTFFKPLLHLIFQNYYYYLYLLYLLQANRCSPYKKIPIILQFY